MKKLTILLTVLLSVVLLSTTGWAFTGKIVAIDGNVVTMEVDGQIPPWVEAGATGRTADGNARITAVEDQKVSLRVREATAQKLNVGGDFEVKATPSAAGRTLQGC